MKNKLVGRGVTRARKKSVRKTSLKEMASRRNVGTEIVLILV